MERHLDALEKYMMWAYGKFAVEYQGELRGDALSQAFRLLCEHYPALTARIQFDGSDYKLNCAPEKSHPEITFINGDYDTLIEKVLKDQGRWRATDSLVYLSVVRGDSRGYVMLALNHAIVDFSAYGEIFAELWRLYDKVLDNPALSVPRRSMLPLAPWELLNSRRAPVVAAPVDRPRSSSDGGNSTEYIVKRIRFSREQTKQLLKVSRAGKTTVTAVVGGIIVVAVRSAEMGAGSRCMTIRTSVNLRNRVDPPVGRTETTNFTGGHYAKLPVSADSEPTEVGNEIKAQVDAAIAGRRELLIPGVSDFDVWVNNPGVLPTLIQRDEIELTDFFVPRKYGKVRINNTSKHPPTVAVVYTYNEEMSVVLTIPFGLQAAINDIEDRVDQTLSRQS